MRFDPRLKLDGRWREGNAVRLLENGEAFYARAFECIDAAREEILLETFILMEDDIGHALQARLCAAAARGVRVEVTADGFGSPGFSDDFRRTFENAGVRFHVFDPRPTLFGLRVHLFRRLHRKLLCIDGERAFVGGINYGMEHVREYGPEAKQDYAVELAGPVVADVCDFMHTALRSPLQSQRWKPAERVDRPRAGDARVMFVMRDNGRHRTSIERAYRLALRQAQRDVLIANAYFFPGFRLLREMLRAARRGVRVRLILQGHPDEPFAQPAARTLYHLLLEAGVDVQEYCSRPFHGKVAAIDEEWSTVGSSNLDPLSLSLNLEANVLVQDRALNRALRERLERLLEHDCSPMRMDALPIPSFLQRLMRPVIYHVLRQFPKWAGWLPAHTPRLVRAAPRR